jgi:hypothetical protein
LDARRVLAQTTQCDVEIDVLEHPFLAPGTRRGKTNST